MFSSGTFEYRMLWDKFWTSTQDRGYLDSLWVWIDLQTRSKNSNLKFLNQTRIKNLWWDVIAISQKWIELVISKIIISIHLLGFIAYYCYSRLKSCIQIIKWRKKCCKGESAIYLLAITSVLRNQRINFTKSYNLEADMG